MALEFGALSEFKFPMSKKKLLEGNVVLNVDTVKARRSLAVGNQHLTSVFFYKTSGQLTNSLSFTGIGGSLHKSETCSASYKDKIFIGDFDGKVQHYEVLSGSSGRSSGAVDDDVTDGSKGPFKRLCVEKLHRSKVVAASVIDVDDVLLLSTASADGFVRLWRIAGSEKFHQVGEFSGRGIPFVSMAAAVTKSKFKKPEAHVFVADLKGVYVLSLHVL